MGKGKKTGKILFTVAGFALGATVGINSNWWGKGLKWFVGGIYGASIASTLWSVTQKPNAFGNLDGDYSQDDTVSSALPPTTSHRMQLFL